MTKIKKNKLNLDELQNVCGEYSEMAFDSLLNEGILKELPVFNTLSSLYKTGMAIKDYLFMKKIEAFLKGVQNIPNGKVANFISTLESEEKKTEVGMKILQIIERLDEVKKAELIGSIFRILIQEEMDTSIFFRICYIIDKCFYEDILELKYFKESDIITANNGDIESEILENLFSNGLLSDHGLDGGDFGGNNSGTLFGLNKYSRIIIRLI